MPIAQRYSMDEVLGCMAAIIFRRLQENYFEYSLVAGATQHKDARELEQCESMILIVA